MPEPASPKVCPKCQFKNSAAKKYCDRCGTELPVEPTTQTPLGSPDQIIPQTVIVKRKGPPPPAPEVGGFNLPQAGRAQQSFDAPAARPKPKKDETTGPRPPRRGPSVMDRFHDFMGEAMGRVGYFVKSVLALLFLTILGLIGFALVRQRQLANRPEIVVKALAERYLEVLRVGDYATAYSMLTPSAQAMTSLDDFRQSRDARDWHWANPRVIAVQGQTALVEYDFSAPGAAPESDYLFFENVNGLWLRPFNWTLLQKAQTALTSNDPDMAVMRSQAAVHVSPSDPLARAYLCESFYFRRLLEDAERECRTALDLSSKYPSKVRGKSLRHLSAVLADSLRGLGRNVEAAAAYDRILSGADLTTPERCDALNARAQARAATGAAEQARADASEAARLCPPAELPQ